ncbi:MAG: hypothetical protein JF887_06430 [Candidatus Dormibacteraeota bacterium]|uniref:Uncharacterized protein n=1 Tax=Candidatus Amunia macphersoniae TaxID=3127014 RepID=A0A934N9H6_9BACT|nr:hypothetical protein [Candidatus Dormibacteraeota bacterium]
MYNRPLRRRLIGLAAVAAATAVGVTTHDAGFTALTFVGTLTLPRILGIGGHRHHGLARFGWGDHAQCGRRRTQDASTNSTTSTTTPTTTPATA